MKKVRAVVLRTAGTNCDEETVYALKVAGAQTESMHINQILKKEKPFLHYRILVIPGGFSYGDDISAGKILANELKYKLYASLKEFVEQGNLVLGICNGFQVLVKSGLLPGIEVMEKEQLVTLSGNDSGKFEARWVYLKTGKLKFQNLWLKGMEEIIYLPIAHAEGKFICKNKLLLDKLKKNGQIIFQYVDKEGNLSGYPQNPNGSVFNIAAICNKKGNVMGMMPHPERYINKYHHPQWTRKKLPEEGDGIFLFKNAVDFAEKNLV